LGPAPYDLRATTDSAVVDPIAPVQLLIMSTDLKEARRDPLFNQSALTNLIWAPRSRKRLDLLVAIIENEPLFKKQDKLPFVHPPFPDVRRLYLNRRQALSRALKGQVRLLELQKEHGWDLDTFITAVGLLDDTYPFLLHIIAFIAVIKAQGTEEQIQEWIPRCERMEILGSL
jgi:hypothetical protein